MLLPLPAGPSIAAIISIFPWRLLRKTRKPPCGSKVGTRLLESIHDEFRARKLPLVLLEVDTKNIGAQKFYEGLDYQRVELLRGYYKGRRDAYRMVKFISPQVDSEFN